MENGELGASLRSANGSEMLGSDVNRSLQVVATSAGGSRLDRRLHQWFARHLLSGYMGGSTALRWYNRRFYRRLFAAVRSRKTCRKSNFPGSEPSRAHQGPLSSTQNKRISSTANIFNRVGRPCGQRKIQTARIYFLSQIYVNYRHTIVRIALCLVSNVARKRMGKIPLYEETIYRMLLCTANRVSAPLQRAASRIPYWHTIHHICCLLISSTLSFSLFELE